MIYELIKKPIVRYVLAGASSYAIELTCLLLLHKYLKISVEFATAIAFWIGLATSFILQKLFAFKNYQKTKKAISQQLGKYSILVGFNYLFTLILVGVLPSKSIIYSRTLALIITTGWNYALYNKFIFRKIEDFENSLKRFV